MTDDIETKRDALETWFHESMTLPGESNPSIEELIPDQFVAENTQFNTLNEFLEDVPLKTDEEDLLDPGIDDFVMANSELGSWQQLQQKVEVRWMKNEEL